MTIAWAPHPGPQTEALARAEFEVLYGGARGGGKTDAGFAWLSKLIQHPEYRFLVIRKNGNDLSDWIDRARLFFKPLGGEVCGNPAVIKFPSGAMGKTGHLKDDNAYTKYVGHEYHRILLEELTLIPSEENYLKLISSCRSTVPGISPRVFATTNPGNAGHIWVKNRFVKHGKGKAFLDPITARHRIFIPSKVTDNPTIMTNDPGYILFLQGLPEKLRRAWLDGDWDVFEGQYFAEWDEKFHVYEPFKIPASWPRFRAMDWGYTDHFCCLWGAVGPDNHVFIYREYYKNRRTDSEYAEEIAALSKEEKINYTVGDPGSFWVKRPETGVARFETFSLNGIPIIPANNDRSPGWSRVREYLQPREYQGGKSAWVHVSRECRNLIRTLPALVHDDKKPEDIMDGMEDHAPDTLRYLLQSRQPLTQVRSKTYKNDYEAALAQAERQERRGLN